MSMMWIDFFNAVARLDRESRYLRFVETPGVRLEDPVDRSLQVVMLSVELALQVVSADPIPHSAAEPYSPGDPFPPQVDDSAKVEPPAPGG